MKLSRHLIVITVILTIFILPLLLISAFAEENTAMTWYADGDNSIQVNAQNKGIDYLFLPASADYSALCISAPVATVISGTNSGETIALPEGEKVTVDATVLFGEMTEGEAYNLNIKTSEGYSTVVLMKSANLSSMHISIEGKLDDVNNSEDKSVSFPGEYTLIGPDGTIYSSGTLDEFKGRGNSSWIRSNGKQPYSIKLSESSELIQNSGKSKRWVLVSENVSKHDITGLSNKVAMQLYRDIGGEYALDSENIDLYVNGKYLGMYMLSEKVGFSGGVIDIADSVYTYEDDKNTTMVVQSGGIVNEPRNWNCVPLKGDNLTISYLEETSVDSAINAGIQAYKYCNDSVMESQDGYLIELDFRFYDEDAWFVTRRGVSIVVCEPKHPGKETVQRIAVYVQRFEDALFSQNGFNDLGDYYGDLLNMESQAKMYLLDSFLCNRDAHRASTYYYATVDSAGEITELNAGPAWDYNSVDMSAIHFFGNDIGCYSYNIIWMTQLASHGDFLYLLNDINSNILAPAIDELLNSKIDEYIEQLTPSQNMNGVLWENNFSYNARQYAEALKSRTEIWNNELWTQDKVLGAHLKWNGISLTAEISGTADNLVWYKYNDVEQTFEEIPNVSGNEYIPYEVGTYSVSVSGKNIIYNARSAMYMSDYSPNGLPSFTLYDTVTVYSNPVDITAAEDNGPEQENNLENTDIDGFSGRTAGGDSDFGQDQAADSSKKEYETSQLTPDSENSILENESKEEKKGITAISASVLILVIILLIIFTKKKRIKRGRHIIK